MIPSRGGRGRKPRNTLKCIHVKVQLQLAPRQKRPLLTSLLLKKSFRSIQQEASLYFNLRLVQRRLVIQDFVAVKAKIGNSMSKRGASPTPFHLNQSADSKAATTDSPFIPKPPRPGARQGL